MTSASPALPPALRTYLSDPSLTALWGKTRDRLERNRLSPTGTLQVHLDAEGAQRLGGLLGTPVEPGLRRIQLAALDTALRASSARCGLVAVVADLTGRTLSDRQAARDEQDTTWAAVWQDLDGELARSGLAEAVWIPGWMADLRGSGILTRAGAQTATTALQNAVRTMAVLGLARTPSVGGPAGQPARWWELGELAAHITGDAHGLDEGRLAGTLTLKGIAAACALPGSESSAGRRLLWEQVGVSADMLSGTVIVWKLSPPGPDPWASMMRARGDLGLATHLTMHELRTAASSAPVAAPQTTVRWCENPQVLQAAARYGLPGILVCGSGNPSSAGWELLQRLLTDGAHVYYHGDFDWAGITIAERVVRLGGRPWRMSAADYLTALADLSTDRLAPLTGEPVATPWDPLLEQAMSEKGLAVHEEALLPRLLADLSA
ncbi:TIGR02679 family protein [Streptomyces sp. NPDC046831]|uniref:TIGR02679 family protein n=1 Tax=Streptomyces sp. NPDC046831 TaxID=3154805 RepID=UPI0033FB148C